MEEATIEDLAFGVSSGQWSQKHAVFAPASQRQLGFRLRSPLWRGTMPAQPSNGFFNHCPSQSNKELGSSRGGRKENGVKNLIGSEAIPKNQSKSRISREIKCQKSSVKY